MAGIIFIAAIGCILSNLQTCLSYPSGAPLQACEEMRPYHPPSTTSGSPPFAINISVNVYKPGSEIKGTIYSPSGVLFRGFLIQARNADNSSTTPVGEFIVSGTTTHTNCGDGNKQGLTHTTNSNKTKIDFTWKAPPSSQGDIHFKLTVVESYNVSRFWLGIYSEVVEDCDLHPSAECEEVTTDTPTTKSGETTETSPTETSPPSIMTTTAPGKMIPYDPECGTTKGCFPNCEDGCEYLVTWQAVAVENDESQAIHFRLQMIVDKTDNVWIAVGLSPTGKMDDTNVMACLSEGTGVNVESSHNEGYQNVYYPTTSMQNSSLYKLDVPCLGYLEKNSSTVPYFSFSVDGSKRSLPKLKKKTTGLSDMKGSAADGKISCSFTRAKSMNITDFINLSDKVYLLVGSGPVVNGEKHRHQKIPVRSANKVDLMSAKVSKEADSATPLIKLHGSLMVLAWVLLSSIGVVVARHFKSMMNEKKMCDVRYWFVVHRTLMFTVLLCVIVAFVAIFYEVGGFSEISAAPGKEYTKAHPYLGIIVTALTLLNPTMAFFRPPLTHKNRFVFNWAHFGVGTLAHITSVVTIFFGINLSKAKVNNYANHVMISYSAVFVIVQFILETHRRINDIGTVSYGKLNSNYVKKTTVTSTELKTYGTSPTDMSGDRENESSKLRSAVLLLYVILMVVAASLLVLMICVPSQFSTS